MDNQTGSNLFGRMLKPSHPVGIIGYGAYVPRYRLPAKEVARIWTGGEGLYPSKRRPSRGWMKTWLPCPLRLPATR
jgi:hypothetical protein